MTITRTRTSAATYALSLIGRSRDRLPVPWTDSAAIDDCARFCSHVLWGGFPISWVDNFKTAGDGSYAAGSGDLQPWDVLLFDWDGNGVGNHVEFFVSHDADRRYVRTFGANGSDTRAAAYRRRPVSYILGRFRPRWQAAATASKPPAETPNRKAPDMIILGNSKGQGLLTDRALTGIPTTKDVRALLAAGVQSATVSDEFYSRLQHDLAVK